ncbi:hypothetical protein B0T21DRAFT_296099, partial [Apiosordaria backusii]
MNKNLNTANKNLRVAFRNEPGTKAAELEALKEDLKTKVQDLGTANNTALGLRSELASLSKKKEEELTQANDKITSMEKQFQEDLRTKDRQLEAARSTITNLKQELLKISSSKSEEAWQADYTI